jgi:hypothetical protein
MQGQTSDAAVVDLLWRHDNVDERIAVLAIKTLNGRSDLIQVGDRDGFAFKRFEKLGRSGLHLGKLALHGADGSIA